jgi:hypothetical protein
MKRQILFKLQLICYMKSNKIFFVLFTAALLSTGNIGCKKALEEEPKATANLGALDATTLEQTIIGVYEPLTRSRGRLWESTVGLGFELMSEYADGGPSQVSWSNYNNLLTQQNALASSWTTLYEAIGRANFLIASLDANTTLSDAVKKKAYGEAYFIRGYSYYFGVRVWGRMPLRLEPILRPTDNTALALSSVAEIYDQVIKDLKAAEAALPNTTTQPGRATAGAAKTALADVYLTLGQYQNARDKAKEVMDNKLTYGYDLEPSLSNLYSATLATNREDIFSLKFSQIVDRGGFMASYWADSKAKAAGYSVSGNKFGGIVSAAPLIKNWSDNDLRKKFSVYNNYLINGVLTAAEVEKDIYDLRLGKYKDPDAPIDTGNGNDFYLFRFADVLLIFAEAENKLNGPTVAAYEAINQVRRRAYGVAINTPSGVADLTSGLSQSAFDEMVFRERGYEFIGEAKRWFDMVRTNRVTQLLNEVRAVIKDPRRKPVPAKLLFALPDVEVQNNPLAK